MESTTVHSDTAGILRSPVLFSDPVCTSNKNKVGLSAVTRVGYSMPGSQKNQKMNRLFPSRSAQPLPSAAEKDSLTRIQNLHQLSPFPLVGYRSTFLNKQHRRSIFHTLEQVVVRYLPNLSFYFQ